MKTIFLFTLLLTLASCGGGGGGGGGSEGSPRSGTNTLRSEEIIECFDDVLGWIDSPPETQIAALESIQGTDLRECGGDKEMRMYVKAVTEQSRKEYEEKK